MISKENVSPSLKFINSTWKRECPLTVIYHSIVSWEQSVWSLWWRLDTVNSTADVSRSRVNSRIETRSWHESWHEILKSRVHISPEVVTTCKLPILVYLTHDGWPIAINTHSFVNVESPLYRFAAIVGIVCSLQICFVRNGRPEFNLPVNLIFDFSLLRIFLQQTRILTELFSTPLTWHRTLVAVQVSLLTDRYYSVIMFYCVLYWEYFHYMMRGRGDDYSCFSDPRWSN